MFVLPDGKIFMESNLIKAKNFDVKYLIWLIVAAGLQRFILYAK